MNTPDPAGDWFRRGVERLDAGLFEDAESCYRKALELEPRHVKAKVNLGMILQRRGQADEAERYYRDALAADPGLAQAWFNLGTVLLDREEPAGALDNFRKAALLEPGHADWHSALGSACQRAGRPLDALASLQTAIQLDPKLTNAHIDLGVCLLNLGDAASATASFRRAQELAPSMHGDASSNLLFTLNFVSGLGPDAVFREHAAWGRRVSGQAPKSEHDNEPNPERRLRIGYLSPDIREHAVSFFIEPVLDRHDRSRFEVVCYSDVEREDAVSRRLHGLGVLWRASAGWSDDRLAEQMRQDGIDILVDLAGHSAGGRRMLLIAAKPAPVQVSWLGYLNTTGLEAVDYRITDWHACPREMERYHTERLIRMPASQWCYRPPADAPDVGPLPAEHDGAITFGSFHNLAKVTPQVIALWAAILRDVPGSRLVVVAQGADQLAERLGAQFQAHGVDSSRIVGRGGMPLNAYLSLHNGVDISLDAFPYAGGTTTFHSLWMGVPVITLGGENVVSRGGVSILSVLDLHELIGRDERHYASIAVELARDRERLGYLRRELRQRLARSPLMDAARFTAALETAYREMWRAWCAGRLSHAPA
jgi:predicted O-linked N-acetylglucosamine transferase (SPINDLY family)